MVVGNMTVLKISSVVFLNLTEPELYWICPYCIKYAGMERHSEELQDPWLLPGWVMVQVGVHSKRRNVNLHLPYQTSQSQPHQGRRSAQSLYTNKAQPSSFIPIPSISPSLIKNPCPSAGFFNPFISSFFLLLRSVLSCSYPGCFFFWSASWGFKGVSHQGEELWDNPSSSSVPAEFVGLWTVKYTQCVSPSSALPCKIIPVYGIWWIHSQWWKGPSKLCARAPGFY